MNSKNHTDPISRVFDLLPYIREKYNREIVFASRQNGKWETVSTTQYIEASNQVSFALLKLGIGKGDNIITISNNRPEFNFVEMGGLQIGAVIIPLYTRISDEKLLSILTELSCRLIVVQGKQQVARICKMIDQLPLLQHIVSFEPADETLSFKDFLKLGREYADFPRLESARKAVNPEDPASVIYISGTNTPELGVVLSHRSHVSNLLHYAQKNHMEGFIAGVSLLPLAHSYERTINYIQQYFGISIYYNEKIPGLIDDLQEVKPEIIVAVPLILERIFSSLVQKSKHGLVHEKFIMKRLLATMSKHPGSKSQSISSRLILFLAKRFVFPSWRKELGGNIRVVLCGGAALKPQLLSIFHASSIPVYEGYGITEAGPLVSYNTTMEFKENTLGKPMPGVQVKVARDGELLVKSPSVMSGYFHNTAGTLYAFTPDGWLHTGDLGEIDADGFITLTGIKKDIFKLTSGLYTDPRPIETRLAGLPGVRKAWVYGHNRGFLTAVIVPEPGILTETGREHPVTVKPTKEGNMELSARMSTVVSSYNSVCSKSEQIVRFEISSHEWTTGNGLLHSDGGYNRQSLFIYYRDIIENFYI